MVKFEQTRATRRPAGFSAMASTPGPRVYRRGEREGQGKRRVGARAVVPEHAEFARGLPPGPGNEHG